VLFLVAASWSALDAHALTERRSDHLGLTRLATARRLVGEALEKLPGHAGFLAFARETETPLPPRAAAVLATRRLPES
jgi:hypothetical protein